MEKMPGVPNDQPLGSLDEWEEDLLRRYPSESTATSVSNNQTANNQTFNDQTKSTFEFRNYEADAKPSVREFYRLNHRFQSVEFVRQKRNEFLKLDRCRMGIWQAMEFLNQLVDDSDPDIDLPQIEHLLQTAEAIRADKRPDWFVLAGLIHDLGKILCLWGEPQWAVVGDTFPVGCRYDERIVFYEMFRENPDWSRPEYQSPFGIYTQQCGLDNVLLSWGHDEYMYHVVRDYLPPPALAMIRYHSCYPIHREAAYGYLLKDADRTMLDWVRDFNRYDLYTKRDERMHVESLRPYYQSLIDKFFPAEIAW